MPDHRIVNPHEVFLEQGNLELAEAFVAETHELDRMPEPLRGNNVETVARMLTAIEVALFDAPPETRQGVACICAVLDGGSMEDGGETRVIFAGGEKRATGGVATTLAWYTGDEFMALGLDRIPE